MTDIDSDDYSTDERRPKRSREEDTFMKSPKMLKTPKKISCQHSDDKLDKLIEMFKEFKTEQHIMKTEQEEIKKEIGKIREQNNILMSENTALKEENNDIKEKLTEVCNKVERLEKEKRRNNVVITGLELQTEDPTLLKSDIEKLINERLQINLLTKKAYKIGTKNLLVGVVAGGGQTNTDEK